MLFDTEKAALNFIKFNRDEIMEKNGKAPTRAYFCDVCGGWHVTSMESFDLESSVQVLEKRVNSHGERDMFDCNLDVIKFMYDEGRYEEALRTAKRKLKSYLEKRILQVGQFRQDVVTPFLSIMSDCTDQMLSMALKFYNKGEFTESQRLANKLHMLISKMENPTQDENVQRFISKYTKETQKLKECAKAAIDGGKKTNPGITVKKPSDNDNVLRTDAKRLPELLRLSQSQLQTGTPFDSLVIAYELYETYYKCQLKGFIGKNNEIHNTVYSHIIDIVMQFVSRIDGYIDNNSFVQAEIELDEFLPFFTDRFARFEDDEKMKQIYSTAKTILEQKKAYIP